MNRRRVLLGSLAALPLAALAQGAGKVWRIGFLAGRSRSTPANPEPWYDAFVDGMRKLGYVEGRNLAIEWRFAENDYRRIPALAAELVRANVDVLVTHVTPGVEALRRETATIPIVTTTISDPVKAGFAVNLARPGGNVTGMTNLGLDLGPKRLELLKSAVPGLARVAYLRNPLVAQSAQWHRDLERFGRTMQVALETLEVRSAEDVERAFDQPAKARFQAALLSNDALLAGMNFGRRLSALALRHRVPLMSPYREHAGLGFLMSYGEDFAAKYRRAAEYIDKILRGTRAGDLPIEQPTQIHLAINTRTANALGLKVPQDLLLRADEVIE